MTNSASVIAPSDASRARLTDAARRALPLIVVVGLPLAWWFSLILVVDLPAVDLTPPKIAVLASLVALLVSRPRIAFQRGDVLILGMLAGYCGWLIVSALSRGSVADIKMTIGYAVWFGGPAAAAFVAARRTPAGLARLLLVVIVLALFLSLAGAVVERVTYPRVGQADPLAAVWRFIRPQVAMVDAIRGILVPPPLHFPSGDPAVPRISSWFAHVNYLAFFGVLTAILAAAAIVDSGLRRGTMAFVAAGGLIASSIVVTWTYSRVGLVGLIGGVLATIGLDAVMRMRREGALRLRLTWAVPVVLVVATVGAALAVDQVGLRRFTTSIDTGPAPGSSADPTTVVETSASRSSEIRLAMQSAAVSLIGQRPATVLFGPGQETYVRAIHDPGGRLYVAQAGAFGDPNSLWLTLALAGGIPAALAMAVILLFVSLRLIRRWNDEPEGSVRIATLGLATWVPVWGVMQIFGTFPFVASEAIILGTLLGASIGLAGVAGRGTATPAIAGGRPIERP